MYVLEHQKTFQTVEISTTCGPLVVEGPVPPKQLAQYTFHEHLMSFRTSQQQQQALIEIATRQEGRIIVARHHTEVIGYVTYLYPDSQERWSENCIDHLMELGAIEVIPKYRGCGTGKKLLEVSFMANEMEDYIIFTTGYYWHWDLQGTHLTVWQYRNMMERMMNTVNFQLLSTDEPEISSHPANCLLARFGKHVSQHTINRFHALRFKNSMNN